MNDREVRLLADLIQTIGVFKFLQLANEIDGNNWKLAERYGVHPRDIVFIRQTFFEQRTSLKPTAMQFINETIHIIHLTERKSA